MSHLTLHSLIKSLSVIELITVWFHWDILDLCCCHTLSSCQVTYIVITQKLNQFVIHTFSCIYLAVTQMRHLKWLTAINQPPPPTNSLSLCVCASSPFHPCLPTLPGQLWWSHGVWWAAAGGCVQSVQLRLLDQEHSGIKLDSPHWSRFEETYGWYHNKAHWMMQNVVVSRVSLTPPAGYKKIYRNTEKNRKKTKKTCTMQTSETVEKASKIRLNSNLIKDLTDGTEECRISNLSKQGSQATILNTSTTTPFTMTSCRPAQGSVEPAGWWLLFGSPGPGDRSKLWLGVWTRNSGQSKDRKVIRGNWNLVMIL